MTGSGYVDRRAKPAPGLAPRAALPGISATSTQVVHRLAWPETHEYPAEITYSVPHPANQIDIFLLRALTSTN
ncbi:hypothetical protein D3C79_1100340 [compost metagenome]